MKDMMKKNNILAAMAVMAIASCDRFDPVDHVFPNSLYLDVSAMEQTHSANYSNKAEGGTQVLAAALSYPEDRDITASITIDRSLVDDYNHKYGTDYSMLPDMYIDFSGATVTIEAGRTTSETVAIGLKGFLGEGDEQKDALEIDRTWLLPVRVSSEDISVMAGSSVAYYLVKRSSAITTAAQLTDNWINFPLLDQPGEIADVYNNLTAVTYEALVYVDKFDLKNSFGECNISTVMGVEQYLLLRIGDANFERQQLQFDGSGNGSQFGKLPSKSDPAKKLDSGVWYHVACTYDQATRTARIYVNGSLTDEVKDTGVTGSSGENRITLAMQALGMEEAYRFCIGWSYNDYRPLQGKIAEARVWRVARTQEEIWANMYRLPDYEAEDYPDLIGYWKFDEGEGNIIHDYSMYGNDGEAE
ncbi:MAG TPA: DUF1735 domain-containing protein, partial [Candidatus Cryptobacteroides intestinipullorum]|nr:DUF1735 domain-containing protein [Candidatus Cryptobacteroides intestinipullorum]